MRKIILALSVPALMFSNSKAGCGGVCIFASPGSLYYGINDTVLLNQGSAVLYANYNDCCNSLFGNNVNLVWCLNGNPFDTTSVGTVNNYMYTQQLTVNQTGVYTVYFIDFVYPNSPSYTCGSVTVEEESSAISSASGPHSGSISISLFPNPANDVLTISCSLPAGERVAIKVFAQNGAEILSSDEVPESGVFTKSIDVSGLSPGLYFVKIQCASATETKKMVKL